MPISRINFLDVCTDFCWIIAVFTCAFIEFPLCMFFPELGPSFKIISRKTVTCGVDIFYLYIWILILCIFR